MDNILNKYFLSDIIQLYTEMDEYIKVMSAYHIFYPRSMAPTILN